MNLRELKDRLLAVPCVYDLVRPLAAGGIDFKLLADFCGLSPDARVFDLGCGTAQLLEYLPCEQYLGSDLDSRALGRAARFASEKARFIQGDAWDDAYRSIRPTVVLMIGVVHHVSDDEFASIIARLRRSDPPPARIVTIDVSFFQGQLVNNLLSRLDRGRYVRRPSEYERLFDGCQLRVLRRDMLPTRMGYVRYVGYHLAFA